jgi:hypothetical protein
VVNNDDKDYDDEDKKYEDRRPTSSYGKKESGKSCKNRNDGNGRYVCIVAGPGKSQHIAVVNDQIVADNSTPKTACISQNACEKIVGSKFEVKSIETRGYCKNGSAHTLVLTDAEVQALVNKIK